jgi:hypothetical protein
MRRLIACCLVLLAGCQTNLSGEKPKDLAYKTSVFEDTVRWGALENMVLFLKIEPGEPLQFQEGLDNVRVISYEVAKPLTQVDDTRWGQTVVIDYVLTDRQIVRQLVDQQVWQTDDGGKTWYRANPVPQFR